MLTFARELCIFLHEAEWETVPADVCTSLQEAFSLPLRTKIAEDGFNVQRGREKLSQKGSLSREAR